jgi:thiamine pyrophosphate-dependent acetolactate synthase large subunit-like protein
VCVNLIDNQPIISANGFISRDLFEVLDKNSNFYMIGSMGLASSIGLGIALKKSKKKIFVFDGDGNILMNLGSLVTIGSKLPKNLVHVIFDNELHESTGRQPTSSSKIDISKIAKVVGYTVCKIKSVKNLNYTIKKILNKSGPILILIKVSKSNKKSPRINIDPIKIKTRFMKSIN